jgi:hypothetical protein
LTEPPSLITKPFIFERSYDEVLAALKHQDDKLNRTLTALAFLTAAGVTLFLSLERIAEPRDPVYFPEGGASVTAVMFVIFLVAVALALITALAAIGPGTPLRFRSGAARSERTSLLFYALIATDSNWEGRYELQDNELNDELGRNFHAEAQNIAKRVRYKVARSRESGAFVQLAILSLTLLGIFEARGLTHSARWWIVSALIVVVLALPLWELVQMQRYGYEDPNWGAPYVWLTIMVLIVAALLVYGELTDHHWEVLYYALFALLLSKLSLLSGRAAQVLLPVAALAAVPAFLIALLS